MVKIIACDSMYNEFDRITEMSFYNDEINFTVEDRETRGITGYAFKQIISNLKMSATKELTYILTWGGPEKLALDNRIEQMKMQLRIKVIDLEPLFDKILPFSSLRNVSKSLGVSRIKQIEPIYDAVAIFSIYKEILNMTNNLMVSLDIYGIYKTNFVETLGKKYMGSIYEIGLKSNILKIRHIASSVFDKPNQEATYMRYLLKYKDKETKPGDNYSELYHLKKTFRKKYPNFYVRVIIMSKSLDTIKPLGITSLEYLENKFNSKGCSKDKLKHYNTMYTHPHFRFNFGRLSEYRLNCIKALNEQEEVTN